MAIIIGAPTFGQMSGSIGGTNCYSFRGRQCVRMKAQPKNVLSPDQAISRNNFNRALNDWQEGNFSLPKSVYEAWGSQSFFTSRGQTYPLTGEQWFVGYRSLWYAHPEFPSEPTLQPSARPKNSNFYPVYFPDYDGVLVFIEGPVYGDDYFFFDYTDQIFPPNNCIPRKFPHSASLYAPLSEEDIIVCHLALNDSAGNTTVKDNTANALNFTFCDAGGNPHTDAHAALGKCNRSLYFDGVDDSISRTYDAKLNWGDTHSFSTWMKSDGSIINNSFFLSCFDPTAGIKKGLMLKFDASGKLTFRYGNGAIDESFQSTFTAPNDEWFHIGYTFSSPTSLYLYLNDAVEGPFHTSSFPAVPTGLPLELGISSGRGIWKGWIDSTRFFDDLLSYPQSFCLYTFEPEHELSYPRVAIFYPKFCTGLYRSWYKARQVTKGGGWSPLRYFSFDIDYPL